MAKFQTQDIIEYLDSHNIQYEERDKGKLFTKKGADLFVNALLKDIQENGGEIIYDEMVKDIIIKDGFFEIATYQNNYTAKNVIISCGSKTTKRYSSDFSSRISKKLDFKFISESPGLTPFFIDSNKYDNFEDLSGISFNAEITIKNKKFKDSILFTKEGLSGPAALDASLYWSEGESLIIDFLPDIKLKEEIQKNRKRNLELKNFLAKYLPKRFIEKLCLWGLISKPLYQYNDIEIEKAIAYFKHFELVPEKKANFDRAEISIGGISTDEISSKTMESNKIKNLYIIGEAIDVAGELGGYNLHWAWASARAVANAIIAKQN